MITIIQTPKFTINNRIIFLYKSTCGISKTNMKMVNSMNWFMTALKTGWQKNNSKVKLISGVALCPVKTLKITPTSVMLPRLGMAGFMQQLKTTLCGHISSQVRCSGEMQVERGSRRPYLHLEHGKIWGISDAMEGV